jgi:hypothetical protein
VCAVAGVVGEGTDVVAADVVAAVARQQTQHCSERGGAGLAVRSPRGTAG